MNVERTKQYYDQLTEKDLCQCAYCRIFAKEIKTAWPCLAAYLNRLGVDIEKPFEVLPLDESPEYMEYLGVQYVVIGTAECFRETTVDQARIYTTESHPSTNIEGEHFVIEIVPDKPFRLKRSEF